jgi:hypothetical protein
VVLRGSLWFTEVHGDPQWIAAELGTSHEQYDSDLHRDPQRFAEDHGDSLKAGPVDP